MGWVGVRGWGGWVRVRVGWGSERGVREGCERAV